MYLSIQQLHLHRVPLIPLQPRSLSPHLPHLFLTLIYQPKVLGVFLYFSSPPIPYPVYQPVILLLPSKRILNPSFRPSMVPLLIQATIMSCLEECSSLSAGVPAAILALLQVILLPAAGGIF